MSYFFTKVCILVARAGVSSAVSAAHTVALMSQEIRGAAGSKAKGNAGAWVNLEFLLSIHAVHEAYGAVRGKATIRVHSIHRL